MRVNVSRLIVGLGVCVVFAGLPVHAKTSDKAETAELLIVLLKAGRAVVSEHQTLINDASTGGKGFTEDFVSQKILERFKAETQIDLSRPNGLPSGEILLAMVQSEREVVSDAQPVINKQGIGFKGFAPSVFARKVGQKFFAKTGIKVKVTAMNYRFPGNQPDDFEAEVLRIFSDPEHPKGQRYAKVSVVDGQQAVRVMYPEYADATCLVCHGDPKGERDIMGMKKEGWKEGDLAGAISVVMPVR